MLFQHYGLIILICLVFWLDSTEAKKKKKSNKKKGYANNQPADIIAEMDQDDGICKRVDIEAFQKEVLSLHNKTTEEIRLLNIGHGLDGSENFKKEIKSTILILQEMLQKELAAGLTNMQDEIIGQFQSQQEETKENFEVFKTGLLESLNIEELPTDITEAEVNFDCMEQANGVHRIVTNSGRQFNTYCQDGWLYIARRFDGSVNFFQDWVLYKEGFGDPAGEFFLGFDNIVSTLGQFSYKLKIEFTVWDDETECEAEYQTFGVSDEDSGYTLSVGDYNGICSDQMKYANGLKFSTRDRDNDNDGDNNVALENVGPGWYSILGEGSNIFGLYTNSSKSNLCQQWMCMFWFDEDEGSVKIIKSFTMKIIPL